MRNCLFLKYFVNVYLRRMKKFLVVIVVIVAVASCGGPTHDGTASSYETNQELYNQALENNDFKTAAVALNYLLLADSSNLEYTDSLARIYLKARNFEAGLRLGQKVLDKYPDNYGLLELVAVAQGYTGEYIASLKNLKKLHEEVGDITYVFMMAQVYVDQQNYSAALEKLDQVIADSGTGYFDAAATNGTQRVNIKAGAYYFKAQEALNKAQGLNDAYYNQGINYLKKALELAPDYEAALALAQEVQMIAQQSAYQQNMQRQGKSSASNEELLRQKQMEEKRKYEEFMKQQGK